ncbi:siderochrome-iron transporter [Ophiostoma piceae UAMH 11346]|uniref:Siderochrome-iron transporter n=1 Tax=Ophiostoma piceae (strain UAMH 11346) TaxID=1262450 RepID=S3BY29_OPHP1|nr:siderochrome-iron transporter [Ophiostoma piceae UAMH 11346]
MPAKASETEFADKDAGLPAKPAIGSNAVAESVSEDLPSLGRNENEMFEHPVEVTRDAHAGVQKAEAVALVWPLWALYATYAWIWMCFFVLGLQASISANIINYVYADFAAAPQVNQAYVLASIISGVAQLPIAKMLNLWGRAEGFLLCLAVFIFGIVIMAACNGPKSFAAGYTIYYVGYTTTNFNLCIFIADSAGLRNRAFAYSFIGAPTICTAFTGPLVAEAFYKHSTWRWSYGSFAVISFFILAPLALVFKFYQHKAEAMGLFAKTTRSGRSVRQSVAHYVVEFDIVGAMLLIAGFVLLLLPFSLQQYGYAGYSSAPFIAMLAVGICVFPAFVLWEMHVAKTPFIKWELFRKPSVVGGCMLSFVIFFNYLAWDTYFYLFVQVVYDLSTAHAGYMNQIYAVGSTVWSILFGLWIRQTRHFKYVCLFFGTPLLMLGAGLMVHFRGTQSQINYIIMCQIFLAVGGGTLVIGDDMAVMASADRESIPMVIALISLFGSVGSAVGSAVAGAIYTNTFPKTLLKGLPAEAQGDFLTIYLGGNVVQMNYPPGSSVRNAINHAYTETQRLLCIAAVCIVALAFPAVAMWKNHNVDKRQNKGTVL